MQVQFAKALEQVGSLDEAEHVLRAATSASSNDWNCWAGLGELLDKKEIATLHGVCWVSATMPSKQLITVTLSCMAPGILQSTTPPTPDVIQEARTLQAEADKCFDRAVALRPSEPQTYIARIVHRSTYGFLRQFIASYKNWDGIRSTDWVKSMMPSEACDDLARLVRLSPTNYMAVGNWGWMELTHALVQEADGSAPESQRTNVLEAMRLLANIGENQPPRTAAGALEALGILRLIGTTDAEAAKAAFQRAVALDPSRNQAWDGLLTVATLSSDPHEFVTACRQRLKHAETIRNRVLLAKALDNAKLPAAALEQARAAVKLDPGDPLAQLCLGALLLRHLRDEEAEEELKETFSAASSAIGAMSAGDGQRQLAITYNLNRIIALALDGEMDQAREDLRQLAATEDQDKDTMDRIKGIKTVIGD